MAQAQLSPALRALDERQLARLVRVADRVLAGHPVLHAGPLRRRRQAGQGTEFLDYRTYVAGSDMRSIDWRASARSSHLLVRWLQQEASSEWYICLDGSASMSLPDPAKWALAQQLAAALGYLLLHRASRVGLYVFSDGLDAICPAGRGRAQYKRLLATLAGAHPPSRGGSSRLEVCAQRLAIRRSALVISDFAARDDMRHALSRMLSAKGHVHTVQLSAVDECALEPQGDVTLRDVETGDRVEVGLGPAATKAADEAQRKQQRALERFCRERGIAYTHCTPSDTWRAVVLRHLIGHRADA